MMGNLGNLPYNTISPFQCLCRKELRDTNQRNTIDFQYLIIDLDSLKESVHGVLTFTQIILKVHLHTEHGYFKERGHTHSRCFGF